MSEQFPSRDKQSCGNCYYWVPDKNSAALGRCHRYAKRPSAMNGANWPIAWNFDWCGEWAPLHEAAE